MMRLYWQQYTADGVMPAAGSVVKNVPVAFTTGTFTGIVASDGVTHAATGLVEADVVRGKSWYDGDGSHSGNRPIIEGE